MPFGKSKNIITSRHSAVGLRMVFMKLFILDMLHMGYVDEVLFGNEVLERMPSLVKEWVELTRTRNR